MLNSLLTAKRYKFACSYVGRSGPDVVDTVLATWSNIAIPSMLSGCEVIPFTETTIEAIEAIHLEFPCLLLTFVLRLNWG